jgi:hypothetical protein
MFMSLSQVGIYTSLSQNLARNQGEPCGFALGRILIDRIRWGVLNLAFRWD